jgi:hypothetical protein
MSYQVGRGSQAWAGFSQADHAMVHKDPVNFIVFKTLPLKQDVKFPEIPVLTPGMQEPINYRYEGLHSVSGSAQTPFYPEQSLSLLKGVLTGVTPTDLTGAWNHKFLGEDTVPNVPFCFTQFEDLSNMNLVGCYPTGVDIEMDKGNPVMLTYPIVGMHGFDQIGVAGTSTGQNAISFSSPIVLVVNVSDRIKLAVDGGSATEVIIPAASYSTAAALIAAINTAIEGTAGLTDKYKRPLVACFLNSASKIEFYSGTKGTGSSVAWTAGTDDAGTLLGRGTPVEAAGIATMSKPSESVIQPFINTQTTMTLDGVNIPGVDKAKISIKSGLDLHQIVGYFFPTLPIIKSRRSVTGTLDVAFTDVNWLVKHLANTTFALLFTLETGVIIGSTAYTYKATIRLNSCKSTKTPVPNVSGTGHITQSIEFKAYADAVYQDVEIDVVNSLATV